MSAQDHLSPKQFMYHAAPRDAAESIRTHGLDWRLDPRAGQPSASQAPMANYFNRTLADARDMMSEGMDRTHDLYKVDVTGMTLHPDPYQPEDAVYTRDRIPPHRITKV